ncbi:hypothetical protein L3Y19_gp086 [Gordonia phage Neville]|uniref:Uncharacterized protein n=2 Tax=Nevillevirus TaxID=3044773 RepID=A0A515MH28_9CAUD|nr:hypothetical protein L3Y19_gp086 [Gordonia phage Neville]YP_010246074.1 hypothetical protein L3Y20_gp089 [Gordonia phage Trax]AXQ64496.1 hypothetical protein SEA_NEVILLE_86 [Gordonia phage Neville]QDM55976.1 hypothetical protein SEA_TRAX_89 [Gordonia phage Trax]
MAQASDRCSPSHQVRLRVRQTIPAIRETAYGAKG